MKGAKAENRVDKLRIIVILFTGVILLSIILSSLATAQIGVSNDPPAWVNLSIIEDENWIYINLALKDLNGWSDIYNATISVYDGRGEPISVITYSQYGNLLPSQINVTTTPLVSWSESVGTQFNSELSAFSPVEISPWNWENAIDFVGLNLTIVMTPFSGEIIKVVVYDRGSPTNGIPPQKAEYTGPFSAEYDIPPYLSNYVYPIGISAIVAGISAIIMTLRRHYSNKLARTINAQEKNN